MKKMRRAAALLLAVLMSFTAAACDQSAGTASAGASSGETASQAETGGETSQPQEDVTLTWWVANTVTADEQKLPQDQWYITKCIERFEEANPGTHVKFTLQTDGMQTI